MVTGQYIHTAALRTATPRATTEGCSVATPPPPSVPPCYYIRRTPLFPCRYGTALPFGRHFYETRAVDVASNNNQNNPTRLFSFFTQGLFYTPKHNQEEFDALPRGSFITTPDERGGGVVDIGPASDETVLRVSVDSAGVVQRLQVVPIEGERGDEGKEDEEAEKAHQNLSDLLAAPGSSNGEGGDGGAHKTPPRRPRPGDVEAHVIYPAKHHVVGRGEMESVMSAIKGEMEERCSQLGLDGKVLEAERLRQRTENDLLLLDAVGTCKVAATLVLVCRLIGFSISPPK